jgi:hypothetical protein
MARNRKFTIAGLNIVTHPHSSDGYVQLFKSFFREALSVLVRKNQRVMLGEMRPIVTGQNLSNGIFGRIYEFDQIDPDAPWFNVKKNEVATNEEVSQITIPADLKPNLAFFEYVFYPKTHKLYFITSYSNESLSPNYVEKLFLQLVELPIIRKNFGKVEIKLMPDKSQLKKILSMHRLAKLTIDVARPNPDDNADAEEEVFKRLEEEHARRIVKVLVAEPNESIVPNEDTKLLAKVAAMHGNGKVEAVGFNQAGERIEVSTSKKPWKEPIIYDPDEITLTDKFLSITSEISK